jgi:hypothetical protein
MPSVFVQKIIYSLICSLWLVGLFYLIFWLYFWVTGKIYNLNKSVNTIYDKFLYYTFYNNYTSPFALILYIIILSPLFFGLTYISPIFSLSSR